MVSRAPLLVISWWSNCLALACLERLQRYTEGRCLYLVQVGKSEAQRARCRQHLPPGVRELTYPARRPAEHSRVIAFAVSHLSRLPGLWFVDHDLILQDNAEPWLCQVDRWLAEVGLTLCLPEVGSSPAVTQPAFWLSPARWPANVSFDPIPFAPRLTARRPDLYRYRGTMARPQKDTLVDARDTLAARGQVGYYPLASATHGSPNWPGPLATFPRHRHLGGLYLLSGPLLPPHFHEWMVTTLSRLRHFFAGCPPAWVESEDPVLLQRLRQFEEAVL